MWGFIKDVSDLVEFFPNLKQNELPDRAFMWGILSTKRREAWKSLLEEARKARGKNNNENTNDLIEIAPEFYEKVMNAPTLVKGRCFWMF